MKNSGIKYVLIKLYINGLNGFKEVIKAVYSYTEIQRCIIHKIRFLVDWELISAKEELKIIKKRQREVLKLAKKKGKKLGRAIVKTPSNFK